MDPQETGRRGERRRHVLDRPLAIKRHEEDLRVTEVTADLHLRESHQPHPRILDLPPDKVGDQTQDLILEPSTALEVAWHLRATL